VQVALAKLGIIPPLITWLDTARQSAGTTATAAKAVLCLATDNATTQGLIGKAEGSAHRTTPFASNAHLPPCVAPSAACLLVWGLVGAVC
jgi:hypothetical protein